MLRDMVSGNQDGDIVFASVLQRQIDKCPARLSGILGPAKDFKDLILARHFRQTVGAKQDAIPVEETQLQHFNVQLVSLRSHDIRQNSVASGARQPLQPRYALHRPALERQCGCE